MDIKNEIRFILRQLGVKTSYVGYKFISYGIYLVLQDQSYLHHVTKKLYIDIALKYKTSPVCVERNIRTVIKSIWSTDNRELLTEICNGNIPNKVTNAEFFNIIYEYFILRYFHIHPSDILDISYIQNNIEDCQCICFKDGMYCNQLNSCYKRISQIESESKRLYSIILLIHNITGEFLKNK